MSSTSNQHSLGVSTTATWWLVSGPGIEPRSSQTWIQRILVPIYGSSYTQTLDDERLSQFAEPPFFTRLAKAVENCKESARDETNYQSVGYNFMLCSIFQHPNSLTDIRPILTIGYAALAHSGREFRNTFT
jgi:hypothetical protein